MIVCCIIKWKMHVIIERIEKEKNLHVDIKFYPGVKMKS